MTSRATYAALAATLILASRASAQTLPGTDISAPAAASVGISMPITVPMDTEVVQAERSVINPPAAPVLPLEQPLDPDAYICGRGDVLELNFWGAQNFKLRVTVDAEGRTFISKVGYVEIVGKTLTQTRAIVKAAVLRYFPGLHFDLGLAEPRTFLVHVAENVVHPGIYPARPIERVASLLARAGGVANGGSRRQIVIERRGGAHLPVDLLLYAQTGDVRYNPMLLDGDVIRVPFEGMTASVTGAVHRPGRFELIHGKDLAELMALAGGPTSAATHALPLRLLRKDAGEREAQQEVPFPSGPLPALGLQPDDALFVPAASELQQSVLLVGAIAGTQATDEATALRRVSFVAGETVRTLLDRVGGLHPGADTRAAYLLRRDGAQIPLDLEALLVRRDFSADHAVAIGDSVVVPFQRRSVLVEGAVFRPAALPYNPRFRVLDYVSAAGGAGRNARPIDEVTVITPEGKTKSFSPDLSVGPGDTVILPERTFSRSEMAQFVLSGVGLLIGATALVVATHH